MDEDAHATALDTRTGVGREPPRRLELLSGAAGRRRSWSFEQKLAIVAEAEGCDNLTALARRHDIRTSQLYTWRRELRYAMEASRAAIEPGPAFVPVVADSAVSEDVAIEVEVDGAVARIGRTASADVAAAVVRALRAPR
jgi:transposase